MRKFLKFLNYLFFFIFLITGLVLLFNALVNGNVKWVHINFNGGWNNIISIALILLLIALFQLLTTILTLIFIWKSQSITFT